MQPALQIAITDSLNFCSHFYGAIQPFYPVALLRMVVPGVGFRGAPFFGPKLGDDQKKKSSPQNQTVFGPNEKRDQTKRKKKGIHHKSVELWFRIIIWCPQKW